VDGEDVTVHALPDFVGLGGLMRQGPVVLRGVSRAVASNDAVILREPGVLSSCLKRFLAVARHPYGAEVVGDPRDVFAPGAVDHPLRRFFRWWGSRELRRVTMFACAVGYTTEHYLQKRYPPNPGAFATHYSSADLPDEAFVSEPRRHLARAGPFRLVAVGSMAQRYKGFDVLLNALRVCVTAGSDQTLTLVGDGRHRPELQSLATTLSLNGRVAFTGELPGPEAVRRVVAGSDVFVHPSRTEGLPRAVLEAMALGLPCIGTTVGGIPELLPPEDTVGPDDAESLSRRIREVLRDPERMNKMSERNLTKAREYHQHVLQKRRNELYRHVRRCTEEYLKRQRKSKGIVDHSWGGRR